MELKNDNNKKKTKKLGTYRRFDGTNKYGYVLISFKYVTREES